MESTLPSQAIKNWKRPFFTIWTGQAFSILGSQLVQFALIWWLSKTTGSATVLAGATLIALVPQILLGPLTGTLVDRWNRRLTMILADSIIVLATLGLAVLFALGVVQVWHVYLIMFIRSVGAGFHWPAMSASTSLMVPKEHLSRVQGVNQFLNGGLNIVSAPLGALLLSILPMQGIVAIDVITAMIAVGPLLFIDIPQPERNHHAEDKDGKTSLWQEMKAGWCYVLGWPGLAIIGVMAALINLILTPAFSLLPILVIKHFNGQAIELGWIESAFGIGVIAGSALLSIWGGFKHRVLTSLVGLVGMGIGTLIIGVIPSSAFYMAVGAMCLVGFMHPITNGPLLAVAQAVVAPDMQGRVFSLINSVSTGMTPLGLAIAGPVADTLGVNIWFIVGGIVTAVMGLAGFLIPAVVNIEDGRQHQ
jgi:DHA3 family macrolide efflux protein-like MFS transporter